MQGWTISVAWLTPELSYAGEVWAPLGLLSKVFDFEFRIGSVVKGENRKMKKIWQKPKLIILSRGRPEESVLAGCKITTVGGPNNSKGKCNLNKTGKCAVCSAITTS